MMYFKNTACFGGNFQTNFGWVRFFFYGISWYKLKKWERNQSIKNLRTRHTFDFKCGKFLIEFLTPNFD